MRSEVIAAVTLAAGVALGVRHYEAKADLAAGEPMTEAAMEAAAPTSIGQAAYAKPASNSWGREVTIAASRDHQFYINAQINRRAAHFLIDTGASYVALRETDARKAGIYTAWTDYTYPVRTANGETKAALVTLDEMEIDGIRIDGVKAFILPDEQLAINLLGMSFLSRLESVEARGGEMILRG